MYNVHVAGTIMRCFELACSFCIPQVLSWYWFGAGVIVVVVVVVVIHIRNVLEKISVRN